MTSYVLGVQPVDPGYRTGGSRSGGHDRATGTPKLAGRDPDAAPLIDPTTSAPTATPGRDRGRPDGRA